MLVGLVSFPRAQQIFGTRILQRRGHALPLLGQLLQKIPDLIQPQLQDFQPQALSNILWGYASLRIKLKLKFLRAVEVQFRKDISRFSPQNISMMMWAFGIMGHRGKYTTLLAMQRSMLERSDEFYQPKNVQAVANISWSMATVGHQPRLKYLQLLEKRLPPLMPVMKEQELVNTIWAMSDFRYVPAAEFLSSMEDALITMLQGERVEPRHRAQHLANSLSALQKLGHRPADELMAVMDRTILDLEMHHFTEQAKANLIWSMTMMDRTELASYRQLWIALEQSMGKEMTVETLGQINQAAMMLKHVHKFRDLDCWELAPTLVRRAVDARKQAIDGIKDGRYKPATSRFHKEVSLVLSVLRLKHTNEFITKEGILVDIKVEDEEDRMIAIEVDGRPHFSVNGGESLGSTITRNRLLKACGWELIVVPLHEWMDLSSFQDRVRYMATKLGDLVSRHQWRSERSPMVSLANLQELVRNEETREGRADWTRVAPMANLMPSPVLSSLQELASKQETRERRAAWKQMDPMVSVDKDGNS